jgi:hypothetical protein
MHQRFDIDRARWLGVGQDRLLLENMRAVLDQHVDHICVQEYSSRDGFERKTIAVSAVLLSVLIQHIFPSAQIPMLQPHRQ